MSSGNSPGAAERTISPRAEQIIKDVGQSLPNGLLPVTVYNDEEIYEAELQRIFAQQWVFVGHETEIPDPGDYAKRYIGEDPFIFTRDEDGEIRLLFNSCRHHGSQICKAEQGNTSAFRCPYHGWTYGNDGSLQGIPAKHQAFKDLDPSEWGLLEAPRVDDYAGMVFASLSEEGPTLEEYLGDYTWYLDLTLKLVKGGMEVIGEPHRWRADFDWKLGADNFSPDSYHNAITHRSTVEVGFAADEISGSAGRERQAHVTHVDTGTIGLRLIDPKEELFLGYPEEIVTDEHLTDEQYELAAGAGSLAGTIFPNLSYIHAAYTNDPKKPLQGALSFRQWQPVGAGKMELWSWVMAPKAASDEYKERVRDIIVGTFSPSGNFEQDDLQVWEGISESARSQFAKQENYKLNYQMGMDGMSEAEIDSDFPGPGTAWTDNLEEGSCRTLHENWYKTMSGGEPGVRYGEFEGGEDNE